jgi:outer membrane protein assembly factor BamD
MQRKLQLVVLSLFFLGLSSGCNSYQKVLNNPDMAAKYKAAEAYYSAGEYRRANRLFEQLLPAYRGKPQAQRIQFFFANTYLEIKDFYLAAYQFESFAKSYPQSDRVDEANFLAAKCYYLLSPRYSLDQKNTIEAMDRLQIFIDNYPRSEYMAEANAYIQELQTKLEKKDFEIAKQYYTIRDYKAAISATENFISSYPGTPFREDALYYKFLSSYEIAVNSIINKKLERLNTTKEMYSTLLRYYPETLFLSDLDKKMKRINIEIDLMNSTTPPTVN